MKRLFLSILAGLMLAPTLSHGAAATPFYVNSGVMSVSFPEIPPSIDAANFVNYGKFAISNYSDIFILGTRGANYLWEGAYPFETWNTVNYTNYGIMAGLPGFRFDFKDSTPTDVFWAKRAGNFFNGHSVNGTNTLIYAERDLLVNATNIVNTGSLIIGSGGRMRLSGANLDLSRGMLSVAQEAELQFGTGTNAFASAHPGVQDRYWGVGTNVMRALFTPDLVVSSPGVVRMFDGFNYFNSFYSFSITNDINAYVSIAARGESNFFVDVLILGHHNPEMNASVRFFNTNGPTTKVVCWESVSTQGTDLPVTNRLYLEDTRPDDPPWLVSRLNGPPTQRPGNYRIYNEYPLWDFLSEIPATTVDPALFQGTNQPLARYSAYGATLTAEPYSVDTTIVGATYSNLPGRIEILSADTLDLTSSRISGASFLKIEAPNFLGSQGAQIDVPYMSVKLSTTNQSMNLSGLVPPLVREIVGDLEVWSGEWTNSGPAGLVTYNVTIVDSLFTGGTPPKLDNLEVRVPELVLSDSLHVINRMLIDTERLTILSNETAFGEIHLLNNNLVWSPAFPSLLYLTNYGSITASNTLYFGQADVPPWQTGGFEAPYNAFVNHGPLYSEGNVTWANHYENYGDVAANFGPIDVRALYARVNDGEWSAPNADITISSAHLSMSNQVLNAARSITLDVTGYLSDGSLENLVDNVTNKNTWAVGAGINLLKLPTYASLLATTVTNTAHPYAPVLSQWAGQDKGAVPEGFVNNAAVGRLVLDGGSNSVFRFTGVSGNNALYVDRLELQNFPSGIPNYGDGTPLGVELLDGFKLYFAQAVANGVDISERLNADALREKGFYWVPEYPGYYSATNMVYPDGTTNRVNAALAASRDLDSDGDTVLNYLDSSPISTFWIHPVVIPTNTVPGSGDGGDDSGDTNPPDNEPGLPTIEHPVEDVPYSGLPTTVGAYYGLFYDENGVALPSSGFCKLTVNKRGVYSGRLVVSGRAYTFTGRLSSEGTGTNYVKRLGATPLSISFEVDDSNGTVEGSVSTENWSATLQADRLQSNAKNKSPFAGRYTMTIEAAGNSGFGYGTVMVTPSGGLVWNGRLGDGSKSTQTAAVSREGVWPLFSTKTDGQSLAISWLKFSGDQLGGQLIWIRSGASTNQLEVKGSRYVRKGGQRVIELFPTSTDGHGRLVFEGAGLTGMTNTVLVNKFNKASFPSGAPVMLQIVPGTGLFQGKFRDAETGRILSFQGALLQEQNCGEGLFMNGSVAGRVYVTPPAP